MALLQGTKLDQCHLDYTESTVVTSVFIVTNVHDATDAQNITDVTNVASCTRSLPTSAVSPVVPHYNCQELFNILCPLPKQFNSRLLCSHRSLHTQQAHPAVLAVLTSIHCISGISKHREGDVETLKARSMSGDSS